MIKFIQGNIFDSEAEMLVNPVNTDGIMGKGLAYQFKKKYPNNFKNYYEKCRTKELDIGNSMVYSRENNKIIVNFPTKTSWRENSRIEYITIGLNKLKELMLKEQIKSVALPPLGAGNGKLDWNKVKGEITRFSIELEKYDFKVYVYEPTLSEIHLNKAHLYLAIILSEINKEPELKKTITDLIFQKIIYMYDIFSDKDYFKFVKYEKGPFSKFLNVVYGELKNYSRTSKSNLETIKEQLQRKNISDNLSKEENYILRTLNFYKNIQKNYKTNNKNEIENIIELLTTLIFLIKENNKVTSEELFQRLVSWNKRKEKKYSYSDLEEALVFLGKENIIYTDIFKKISLLKAAW
ncbi:MAG: macro domain-containing protein [Cetobacterium sp.]